MKEYEITYSAQFKVKITVDDDCQPGDEEFGCDIDIPEGGEDNSVYVADSFEIDNVESLFIEKDSFVNKNDAVERYVVLSIDGCIEGVYISVERAFEYIKNWLESCDGLEHFRKLSLYDNKVYDGNGNVLYTIYKTHMRD